MALSVVSSAWMRQAAYEKALLDIDGDKDVSRNEPFLRGYGDPAPHAVSYRLYLPGKTAFFPLNEWFRGNVVGKKCI